jgi:FlaA1/EpsC-like NDP-sugar epimerase
VADAKRLSEVVCAFKPDILVHAAALKHVDLVEENWRAAVRTNVFGTMSALDAANEHCVPVFINISTDKAVEPVGVLGLTKRMGERLVAAASSQRGVVRFSVRFGNVLGSSGSVIDTFLNQIAAGGPITLTDERVQRYFMSRTEAAELVLASCTIGETSRLFLLDMGEPILIKDLAAQLIEWSGRAPDEDIKIVTTGLRPGERLEEKLVAEDERVFPSIFSGISCIDSADIKLCDLTHLAASVETGALNLTRKLLNGAEAADMSKQALARYVN